jgi:flagellar FliL protein
MKKNLLTILILALMIVNVALSVITMISVTGTNKKTAALVDTIATVLNLEIVTES